MGLPSIQNEGQKGRIDGKIDVRIKGARARAVIAAHDSADGERLAVPIEAAAQHAWVGLEALLPKRVAEDSGLLIAGTERTAKPGAGAEQPEIIGGSFESEHVLDAVLVTHVDCSHGGDRHSSERRARGDVLVIQVLVIR